jgi:hypothetical protein
MECDRPTFLFHGCQGPAYGPCSNCKIHVSSRWRRHPLVEGQTVVMPALPMFGNTRRIAQEHFRLQSGSPRFCLICHSTQTRRWVRHRDPLGAPTAYWRCDSCYQNPLRAHTRLLQHLKIFQCHVCGTTDSPSWPGNGARTCQNCYKEKYQKKTIAGRPKANCYNCGGKIDHDKDKRAWWEITE